MNKDVEIESFLEGKSDKKYVVAIECDSSSTHASVVVHDPVNGKYIEDIKFNPFIFMKELPDDLKQKFYGNDTGKKKWAMEKNGITIKRLRTKDKKNNDLERLYNGYKYLVSTTKTFSEIVTFFKFGGIDIFKNSSLFFRVKPQEQFMMQTGIRLFKGFEFYNDIHKATFDIETTGLDPLDKRVFMIGLKDNKGYEKVFEVEKTDDDISELKLILDFFADLDIMKPALLSGYNSENFDFNFLLKRLEILGYDIKEIKLGLNKTHIRRREGVSIKFGGDTEAYTQTIIFGYNVIDIMHAVRRAKAINSDIKKVSLKYITKYCDANKPNRMYVDGDKIYDFWNENNLFIINKENNHYVKIPNELQQEVRNILNDIELEGSNSSVYSNELNVFLDSNPDKTDFITGKEIIRQYLLDDLWETEVVDSIYNESTFMVSKWLPTTYQRTATIGGAASWNMIMTTWSYENNISIPYAIKKRDFVGGISRTFRLGFSKRILKADFAGLYPSIQLEDNVFPIYDVDSVLYRLLKFFKENRDVYKKKAKVEKDPKLKKFYDTKQLPLKIFNNSNFGANGSEFFNWSDMDIAERITCSGRQYLRKLTNYFFVLGFKPLVEDTDGLNVIVPEYLTKDVNTLEDCDPIKIEDITYIDRNNIEHKGLEAFFEKFNQDLLNAKYMKVDNDGEWISGLNIARKNYVSFEREEKNGKIKEKMKLIGNSIKSSTLPEYAENFINKGLDHLVRDQGKDFVELYYKLVNDIYYKQLPAKQLASKARVKKSLREYTHDVYIPFLIKTIFLYKNIDIDKKTKKILEEEVDAYEEVVVDTELNNVEEIEDDENIEVPEVIEPEIILADKIYEEFFTKFKKEVAKVRKTGRIEKQLFSKYQDKFDYIIKHEYYINQSTPAFINKPFKEVFEGDFMLFVNEIYDSIQTLDDFKKFNKEMKDYLKIKGNKNGQAASRQAHMDLLIENNCVVDLGDVVYYINTGLKKANDGSKTDKNGEGFLHLLNEDGTLYKNPEEKINYNSEKYIFDINKKLEGLLVVFKQNIKETLLITKPEDRQYYTEEDLTLVSYDYNTYPYDRNEDLDDLFNDTKNVALFKMEDREVRFWNKIGIDPKIIFDGFTTDKEKIDVNSYFDKYIELRDKLKVKGINLKYTKGRIEEGDVVLIEENNRFYLSIYENGVFHKEREV